MIQILKNNAWWLSLVIGIIAIIISLVPNETKQFIVMVFRWFKDPTNIIIFLLLILLLMVSRK